MGKKNRKPANGNNQTNGNKSKLKKGGDSSVNNRPKTNLGRKIKKKSNQSQKEREEELDRSLDFGGLLRGQGGDIDELGLLDADRDEENLGSDEEESDEAPEPKLTKAKFTLPPKVEKVTILTEEHKLLATRKPTKETKVDPQSLKLPIKDIKGKLIRADQLPKEAEEEEEVEEGEGEVSTVKKVKLVTSKAVKEVPESESEDDDEEGGDSEIEQEEESKEGNRLPNQSDGYLKVKLEELAQLAQHFLLDPEANYKILKNFKDFTVDKNIQVRKFALLTQLSVFLDALPGYRIRALTEEEKAVKVSKEVRKLRLYEEFLVSSYQSFLKVLNNQFKIASHNPAKYGELRPVIAKCFSQLMVTNPDFNFSDQLFEFVARRLSTCRQDEVYFMCLEATTRLFKEDELGRDSLQMILALTKSIKQKQYKVAPPTIRLFLHLKFSINVLNANNKDHKADSDKAGNKRKRTKMTVDLKLLSEQRERLSKKMKKRAKLQKEIDLELREAEAEYTLEERSRVQSDLLKNIFIIYFRILKESTSTLLFPVTLEGLSKFGHLISVEFFSDLLDLLKGVLKNGLVINQPTGLDSPDEAIIHSSGEELRCQLLCVLTAFKLLSGQGEALNLDLKDFYTHLYVLLPIAAHLPDKEEGKDAVTPARPEDFAAPSIPLLVVDCIDALFFRNRQEKVPLVRAASFFKRIVYLSFHFPHQITARLLNMAKAFVIKYPGLTRMFTTEEMTGEGQYSEFATDPDQANPFATSLYELPTLLRQHYDPAVRKAAHGLLKAALAR